MDTASAGPSTFQRIRTRYRTDPPPDALVKRDIDRLVAVAEAAKAALEKKCDERMQRLYDALVVVLKDD